MLFFSILRKLKVSDCSNYKDFNIYTARLQIFFTNKLTNYPILFSLKINSLYASFKVDI